MFVPKLNRQWKDIKAEGAVIAKIAKKRRKKKVKQNNRGGKEENPDRIAKARKKMGDAHWGFRKVGGAQPLSPQKRSIENTNWLQCLMKILQNIQ